MTQLQIKEKIDAKRNEKSDRSQIEAEDRGNGIKVIGYQFPHFYFILSAITIYPLNWLFTSSQLNLNENSNIKKYWKISL